MENSEPKIEIERDMGVQPLDTLMKEWQINNTDLVRVSGKQLSHKAVNKGRAGKRITRKMQLKILDAYQNWSREEGKGNPEITWEELFNYRGN